MLQCSMNAVLQILSKIHVLQFCRIWLINARQTCLDQDTELDWIWPIQGLFLADKQKNPNLFLLRNRIVNVDMLVGMVAGDQYISQGEKS